MNAITNWDDIIDSRDIIDRLEELDNLAEDGELSPEDAEELAALRKLYEEGEGVTEDWSYGATLVRETYFRDYARELAEEIGAIPDDMDWPCCHIDWDAAADSLAIDYTEVDFDGVTYLVR